MRGSFQSSPHFVILNLFQDNKQPSRVILKQVQDDDDFFDSREAAKARSVGGLL
jgi:hypothetical protein